MKTFLITILVLHLLGVIGEIYVNHKCPTKERLLVKRFILLNFLPVLGPIVGIFVLLFVYLETKEFKERNDESKKN